MSSKYVRTYEITQHVGEVDYEVALHVELDSINLVFHVSMLKKFLGDSTSILLVEGLWVNVELSYKEVLFEILGR